MSVHTSVLEIQIRIILNHPTVSLYKSRIKKEPTYESKCHITPTYLDYIIYSLLDMRINMAHFSCYFLSRTK